MRNKIWVKIIAWVALIAFCSVMILSVTMSPAFAAKSDDIKKNIENAKKQQEQAKNAKEKLDAQIIEIASRIHLLETDIGDLNKQIEEKEEELEKAQDKREKQEQSFYKRVQVIVESGPVSYLDVLVKSKSFSEFLINMEVVSQIAEYDSQLLEQLKEIEEKIQTLKTDLEDERNTVEEKLTECENERNALNQKIAENESYIKKLESNISEYQKAYDKARQEEEAAWRAAQSKMSNGQFVGGEFGWPSDSSYNITSYYGVRIHPILKTQKGHTGIDIGASHGTNVLASNSGTVIMASYNGGYGNCVMIDHGGGYVSLYGHNSSLNVSVGQKVSRGQVIAKVGSTGMSTGPHIHFEIRINGSTVNPLPYVQK